MPVPFFLLALLVVVAVGTVAGGAYVWWSRRAERRDPVLRWHQRHVRALMHREQDEGGDFPQTVMHPLSDWQKPPDEARHGAGTPDRRTPQPAEPGRSSRS
ncbi:MAG: hypothetical protein AB7P21_01345 [Lautropia sp.]